MSILTSMQRFKSMKLVCLAGFSAGAQYLNRYAWASDVGFNSQQKTSTPVVRFILSDAASYLYFSSVRPDPLCRPMNSTVTTSSNCRSFSIPKNGIEIEMELEWEHMPCPEYDSWKHGTTGIPSLGYNYLSKFSEKNSDAEVSKMFSTNTTYDVMIFPFYRCQNLIKLWPSAQRIYVLYLVRNCKSLTLRLFIEFSL